MNIHIVTGGSSGIGKECAATFKDGKVIITARNEEKLQKAVEELKERGIDAEYKTCDISSREAVRELMEYAKSLGNVKSIVNSAGVSGVGVSARKTFEIDLIGSEYILEEALKVIGENGVIVLIASMMGTVVPEDPSYVDILKNPLVEGNIDKLVSIINDDASLAYNFSKKGTQLLVKKYVDDFGAKGARILSLSPGVIMTPMAEKAAEAHPEQMNFLRDNTPAGRNGRPEDISNMLEFLTSDKASFITGTDILVDGGLANNLKNMQR